LFALSLNNLMNGLSRPLFGWVSDWLGREMTMFLTFLAEGVGILYLDRYGSNPVDFVILAGLVFFAWGNISVFSRRSPRTTSATSTPPPTTRCSIPRKAAPRSSCPSAASSPPGPEVGTRR